MGGHPAGALRKPVRVQIKIHRTLRHRLDPVAIQIDRQRIENQRHKIGKLTLEVLEPGFEVGYAESDKQAGSEIRQIYRVLLVNNAADFKLECRNAFLGRTQDFEMIKSLNDEFAIVVNVQNISDAGECDISGIKILEDNGISVCAVPIVVKYY